MSRDPNSYQLQDNDQIFFLHIPKTGGMSLKQVLKRQVGRERFHQIPIRKFGEAHSLGLAPYRCIRAHWDYEFFRVLARKPVYITMLREPVKRMLSLFGMIRRKPNSPWHTDDIHEFIDIMGAQRLMVHFLAGAVTGRMLSGQALLEVALTRLEECAWFGITEYFVDSVNLLCDTFGWPEVSSIESRNEASPDSRVQPNQVIVDHIEEVCQMDIALYREALQTFRLRLAS